ncbi:hypothetical protein V490_06429 [Pseudogymnoascus sp. VKM F-3557]|nr:hypothetical protein V490_06429 [Pseudogymnoascus sp. VKM F-3557]
MSIRSTEIRTHPKDSSAQMDEFDLWFKNRLDRSKTLKKFTIFNKLIPELRLKIWAHCMPPPGRAVFHHSVFTLFHPDEGVTARPNKFFWGSTPVIFQVCRESRYIGKQRVFPVTGLYDESDRYNHPIYQRITRHVPGCVCLRTLWFSPKDTIEIPVRTFYEFRGVDIVAERISGVWVKEVNPLKVHKVQLSFLISDKNRVDTSVVEALCTFAALVGVVGPSATIFIGMGAGYCHESSRFYLNDDQERFTFNEDGTLCNPELNRLLGPKPDGWYLGMDLHPSNLTSKASKFHGLGSKVESYCARWQQRRLNVVEPPCAVSSYKDAYAYCLNSEIIEEHIATLNPQIKYVDEVRDSLAKDGFAGGWERGEAWRLGVSFEKSGLYTKICRGQDGWTYGWTSNAA